MHITAKLKAYWLVDIILQWQYLILISLNRTVNIILYSLVDMFGCQTIPSANTQTNHPSGYSIYGIATICYVETHSKVQTSYA